MYTRSIGSLAVSVVGLGCNNFGRRVDEAGTRSVLDAAIDAGVTFLDTADVYGDGQSETFLGRALQGRRERVVLATKFGWRGEGEGGGGHPDHLPAALEASLRRLQVDHVDLYQLHRPDPGTPIADTLGALAELVRAGQVREIGCSNFSVDQLEQAEAAVAAGAPRFVSVQNQYSMLHRAPEQGVLEACERLSLAFVPYFPLKSGLLTGKYRLGRPLPPGARITADPRFAELVSDESLARVEGLIAFADEHGKALVDLAFAWLLARPTVASVIAGATTAEQVRRNASAASWRLGADELTALDALLA
jgi:aryl-alcohol dehydrogenase-like predicted oxidoreductase